MNKPKLGVCYYPEHWPQGRWEDDARQMRDMGLSWVRIGEFAWSRLEPAPGNFQWDWLDKAINVLGRAGLKVVLGTPTATPPRWMLDKWPDMLAYDKNGAPRKFGSRRHYCLSHEGYKTECARIAQKLGDRYGRNPHIHSWQIDNEYGCHDTTVSYSPHAETAFQIWLKNKYGTTNALNNAWGNVFWSMDYDQFDQISLPNLTVTEPNPSHVLDFRRFSSDQTAAFNKVQTDILRPLTDMPLIHNYMGRITDFDHFAVGKDLDIASWDSYPLGFLEDRSDQGDAFKRLYMRQGDPDFQAFHHDIYRAVGKGRWWVMEQQPGPVNWAPFNPAPLPGMVRLWSWEAVAHEAEVVTYFRWRQAPFAQEQMHAGLQRADYQMAQGGHEAKTFASELALLPDFKSAPSRVAIVFDYQSAWAWEIQPQGQSFDYFRLVFDYYRGLRRLGISVDILPPNTNDFGDRDAVFIPGLFSWTEELKTAMSSFKGGLVIGPRTGSKTPDFQIPGTLPPEISGIKISFVETLRPDAPVLLESGGSFRIWKEEIETEHPFTLKLDGGGPAVVEAGNIHYVSGWPDDEAMNKILQALPGLKTEPLTNGLRRRDFGHLSLYMNYGDTPVSHKGKTLDPAGVLLIDNQAGSVLME